MRPSAMLLALKKRGLRAGSRVVAGAPRAAAEASTSATQTRSAMKRWMICIKIGASSATFTRPISSCAPNNATNAQDSRWVATALISAIVAPAGWTSRWVACQMLGSLSRM